jgi:hypothetical protein
MRRSKHQAGATLIEFVLAGIPSIFLLISIFQMSMAMWNYHTVASAVKDTARYVSVKGRGCTVTGNTCSITVGDIAHKMARAAIGLPPERISATLTTQSGQTRVCNPLNSCYSDATVWPPASNYDNAPQSAVKISAQYSFPSPVALAWPGAATTSSSSFTLGATSSQQIIF